MKLFVQANARYWRQITLLVLTLISVLSLMPLAHLPDAPGSDKTHHLIAYFALAFPVALGGERKWFLLIPVYILWGGAIELIQPFVNRYAEWLDFIANSLGVGLGAIVGLALRRLHKLRRDTG